MLADPDKIYVAIAYRERAAGRAETFSTFPFSGTSPAVMPGDADGLEKVARHRLLLTYGTPLRDIQRIEVFELGGPVLTMTDTR